jgi:VCBS repeat-containing protein
LTQAETRLSKNGGSYAQKNDSGTASHQEEGNYAVALNATDTGTLGAMRASIYVSGALPVWRDFMIVPANVWDSFFGASKLLVSVNDIVANAINAAAIAADAITAAKIATDAITAAKIAANAITSAKIAADAIGATQIAADAITAGKIAPDSIGASELAGDAATEIANAVKAAVIETAGNYTLQQALSIMLAVLAGRTSSSGATMSTPDGSATRVAATIDGSNNRTAMALTPSS